MLRDDTRLLTSNLYVLLETSALLQQRIGPAALRAFHPEVRPVLEVDWVSPERQQSGVEAALTAGRRK